MACTVRICATFYWKNWTDLEQRNRFWCKTRPGITIGNILIIFSLASRCNVALTATCDRTMGVRWRTQVALAPRGIIFRMTLIDER